MTERLNATPTPVGQPARQLWRQSAKSSYCPRRCQTREGCKLTGVTFNVKSVAVISNGCSVRWKRRTRKTTAADDIQHPATLHASLSDILPSNSAIIGYATDRTLFISAHLSTEIFSVTLSAVIFVRTVTMEVHLTWRRSTHVNIGCFCYGLKNKIKFYVIIVMCSVIIVTCSFVGYFFKLEHIDHYKAKNQNTAKSTSWHARGIILCYNSTRKSTLLL